MKALITSLYVAFICVNAAFCQIYLQPEQVHLSLGVYDGEVVVTWVTRNATKQSVVEFGMSITMDQSAVGNATLFTDGGDQHRSMYVHRVKLAVKPGAPYYYHVGSPLEAWSAVFYFKSPLASSSWSPRIAFYGDLGNINSKSMAYLQQEVQRGNYDAILHVGDFAYDMNSNNAQVGDEFMRMIEAVAAYVPYMTCPGNHESAYNFSNYINRFSMPGGSNNSLFYSFNIGPAHVISFSTEYYFYGWIYGFDTVKAQFNWLIEDLKEANEPQNRNYRPWIIAMGHRPMYCSNNDGDDCTKNNSIIRTGFEALGLCGLEDLFYEYGVDFQIWAHEHSYERLWPVYNMTIANGTSVPGNPYADPQAPVHVITGSAGCQEDHDGFIPNPAPWSAFRSDDYGFSTMTIFNATHINVKQFSVDQDAVIDEFWITKSQPYPPYYGKLSRRDNPQSLRDGCKTYVRDPWRSLLKH